MSLRNLGKIDGIHNASGAISAGWFGGRFASYPEGRGRGEKTAGDRIAARGPALHLHRIAPPEDRSTRMRSGRRGPPRECGPQSPNPTGGDPRRGSLQIGKVE